MLDDDNFELLKAVFQKTLTDSPGVTHLIGVCYDPEEETLVLTLVPQEEEKN